MTIDNPERAFAVRLFEYTSASTFLRDYVAAKRAHNAGWSIGGWARRIRVTNTATLTRVLQGDRNVGPQLIEKLIASFAFDTRQAEYFRCLTLIDKLSPKSVDHTRAMERLQSLRTAPQLPAHDLPLMELHGRKLLSLWGSSDPGVVSRLLAPFGMEAVVGEDGGCLSGLSTIEFTQNMLGDFRQSTIGVLAKRRGAPLDQAGIYYPFMFCDHLVLSAIGDRVWGNVYHWTKIHIAPGVGVVSSRGKTLFTLRLHVRAELREQIHEDAFYSFSNRPKNPLRYFLRNETIGCSIDFDAARDTYDFGDGTKVSSWLNAWGFAPRYWRTASQFRGQLYKPIPL